MMRERSWIPPSVFAIRYAPEAGVRILIVRLKPVTKRSPQQRSGGPRRAAFQNEMLAIKKVRLISSIKGKRSEAGERCEFTGSPFPSISQHSHGTEGTDVFCGGAHWRRIPAKSIKIPAPLNLRVISPRVFSLRAIRSSVCSAMPLLLGGQRFAGPSRIRACFRVTGVNRPIEWQRDGFEHSAPKPFPIPLFPETGLSDSMVLNPFPIRILPK